MELVRTRLEASQSEAGPTRLVTLIKLLVYGALGTLL